MLRNRQAGCGDAEAHRRLSAQHSKGSGFGRGAVSSRREEAMGIPEQGTLTKEHTSPEWTDIQEQVAYATQGNSRLLQAP